MNIPFANPKTKVDSQGRTLVQSGQVVKDGKVVSEQYEVLFDPKRALFCWRHPDITDHLANKQKPTEDDKKKLDKIKFKPFKTTDKRGNVEMGKSCPKCFNTVKIEVNRVLKASLDTDINEISNQLSQNNQVG